MTSKQEKYIIAGLKDYEQRIKRLEMMLSASLMAKGDGVDGSRSNERVRTHQPASQSIEASRHEAVPVSPEGS